MKVRLTISVSITDKNVQKALEKYKEEGKNVSELIQNLLKSYFFDGNRDQINLFDSLSNQLSSLLNEVHSLLNEVQSLRQKVEEEKRREDETLIEKIKTDEYYDFTKFLQSPNSENIRLMKLRIAVFAKNYKIPLPKAEELFKQVYPELEKYI